MKRSETIAASKNGRLATPPQRGQVSKHQPKPGIALPATVWYLYCKAGLGCL